MDHEQRAMGVCRERAAGQQHSDFVSILTGGDGPSWLNVGGSSGVVKWCGGSKPSLTLNGSLMGTPAWRWTGLLRPPQVQKRWLKIEAKECGVVVCAAEEQQ